MGFFEPSAIKTRVAPLNEQLLAAVLAAVVVPFTPVTLLVRGVRVVAVPARAVPKAWPESAKQGVVKAVVAARAML
ncbi:MAG: hypothetical protein ACK5MT_15535, partial [Actinomycetales bacterium]